VNCPSGIVLHLRSKEYTQKPCARENGSQIIVVTRRQKRDPNAPPKHATAHQFAALKSIVQREGEKPGTGKQKYLKVESGLREHAKKREGRKKASQCAEVAQPDVRRVDSPTAYIKGALTLCPMPGAMGCHITEGGPP